MYILTTWTQISRNCFFNFIHRIHNLNILIINWIQTVCVACFNWNFVRKIQTLFAISCPRAATSSGFWDPFHHPLPSRDPCDCLTLQRNFLGTNLPDGTNFTGSKFGESSALESAENSDFFSCNKEYVCTISAKPHSRRLSYIEPLLKHSKFQ